LEENLKNQLSVIARLDSDNDTVMIFHLIAAKIKYIKKGDAKHRLF